MFWGGFLYSGTISTLWPLLGIANQLLATTALAVGTAVILRMHPNRRRYALVTAVPMLVVGCTTLTAGWQSIWNNFSRDPSRVKAVVNSGCTAILMCSCVLVLLTLASRVRSMSAVGDRSQDKPT